MPHIHMQQTRRVKMCLPMKGKFRTIRIVCVSSAQMFHHIGVTNAGVSLKQVPFIQLVSKFLQASLVVLCFELFCKRKTKLPCHFGHGNHHLHSLLHHARPRLRSAGVCTSCRIPFPVPTCKSTGFLKVVAGVNVVGTFLKEMLWVVTQF